MNATYLWCVAVIVVFNCGAVLSVDTDCDTHCANLKGLKDGVAKINAYIAEAEKKCTPKAVCPVDWILHGNSCYYFSYNLTTWNNARIECANRGGYLVEVDNDQENLWLVSMLKDDVWIGLTDSKTEGQWRWNTGSSSTYTNWQSGEPNGGRGENCVHYCDKSCHKSYYGWNDRPCTFPTGYACERHLDN